MPGRKWHGEGGQQEGGSQQKSEAHPLGEFAWLITHVAEEICRLKKCEEIRVRRKERQGGEER